MVFSAPRRHIIALLATTALCAPAAAQDMIELDPIILDSASYETEDTDSYTTDMISVGEKATMTPREVPQSTSVVTRKQIEDGNYTALEEALADTPGLLIATNNVGRSSIFSRGYEFDYLYFDGLPAPVSSIYGTQPDLSIVDHVEVLKGPAGLFIGTGEPAGSINMRLKQATKTEFGGYIAGSIDSNGQKRAEVDVSDALNAEGTLRGRFVAAKGGGDSFVEGVENGVTSLYGALAYDATPDTTLTLSISHMERDIVPYNGLPAYSDNDLIWLDADATTVLDWNTFENATTDVVAAAEHFFANGSRLKFSARHSRQEADFLYGYTGSAANDDNEVTRVSYLDRDFSQESLALDLHAEIPFVLGSMAGTAIVGADWQKVDGTTKEARGAVTGLFDLDDWDMGAVSKPDTSYSTKTTTETESRGLYTQLRLSPIEPLTLIGGARVSWYDGTTKTETLSTGAVSTEDFEVEGHVTPFAGLTYNVSDSTTLYASYSEIFIPQSDLDSSGDLLDPVEGQQFEVGVKAAITDSLNISAAYFDLKEVNRPVAVVGESYFEAEEEVQSKGFEVEISGEPTENLHLSAGYTYTETSYLNGDSEGDAFSTITPENMFKLTANYDFDQGPLTGWSLGGRVTSVSEFSSRGVEAPGYTVVDVMAQKDIGNGILLSAGIDNVFDEEYYTRVGSNVVFNFRGAPRTFEIGIKKTF